MPVLRAWRALLLLVAHSALASAAAPPASAATPPAAAGSGTAAPAGSAAPSMGHPPVGASANRLPAGHPGLGAERTPPEDHSAPSSAVPAGSIEVALVDADEQPQPNVEVRLGILHQTIAEGETRENKLVRTDAQGKARFSNLKTATDYSYRVSVRRGPATYAAAPFQFRNDMGQNVTLHLFPVTQDIQKALLGMRGIVAVETRDDVFQFEVLFRIFNIGSVTWVPSNVVLELPAASKGITAQEGMTDTRFVTEGDRRVRLVGTFGPGQHDLTFRFQVTKDDASRAQFHLTLPPHVASMRVIAQSAPGMELFVDGFDPAEPTLDSNGQHLLITDKQLRAGEPQLKELSLILSGLPTPGPGRWIAVALAAGLFVSGVAAAARSSEQPRKLDPEQVENARQLLITELVALQKARNSEQIGPATYEATRRRLFEALARLQLSRATETAVKPKSARLKTAAPNPS